MLMRILTESLAAIDAASDRFARAAARTARGGPDADPVQDTVTEMEAAQDVKLQTSVLRTADEMVGTLVNIKA